MLTQIKDQKTDRTDHDQTADKIQPAETALPDRQGNLPDNIFIIIKIIQLIEKIAVILFIKLIVFFIVFIDLGIIVVILRLRIVLSLHGFPQGL